jgi:endoglucanase
MGGGPALTHRDRATISDPELVRLFVAAAEENGIPYQFKQPNIGGTDAGRIHLAKGGARSMAVAVPCRYIHSPVSFAHKKDIEHAGRLLRAVLKKL